MSMLVAIVVLVNGFNLGISGPITSGTITRIPNIEGLPAPHPYAISADGSTVVGQFAPGNPFIWRGGSTQRFRPVADPSVLDLYAQATNANGSIVVGKASGAYLWTRANGAKKIPLLKGDLDSFAYAVTPDGKAVVGLSETGRHTRGFYWRASGELLSIEPPEGFRSCLPLAISSAGSLVTGIANEGGNTRAFTWTSKGSKALPLPNQFTDSNAYAMSASGQHIVGNATNEYATVAAIWNKGIPKALPNRGEVDSTAKCITSDGTFLGGYAGDDATIWSADGSAINLNTLLTKSGNSREWKLESVNGIARRGKRLYVTGWAHYGSKEAGYFATLKIR